MQHDASGWFQVDLILPHVVKALGVKGRPNPTVQFMKRAHLTYSNDSYTWSSFKDGKVRLPKVTVFTSAEGRRIGFRFRSSV